VENPFEPVISADPRFKTEAYIFLHEALNHTQALFKRQRHVSGKELLEGIRDLALKRYGPMAKAVLNSWGVRKTDDFGSVVFNLVNAGLLSRTEEDSIDDFHAVYDFDEAFVLSYKIENRKPTRRD
jgi:uncharacterized repeat protein (TIGR04138 family)